jgi:small GTP-binding protein
MDLERERGITIKMAPVRMRWSKDGKDYTLNLIDTPGHVDFAYEVSRALTAVEGVILLVDSTQGVEAQTLSVLAVARELNRVIIPVLSKVDAPHARVEDVKSEVAILLGIDESEILECSGKTGVGVTDLLNAVIDRVPPPVAVTKGMSALVFDFGYSDHRGIIIYARMMGGSVRKGDKLKLVAANEPFTVAEVGVLRPTEVPVETLNDGEIGYMVTGVKEPGIVRVGDTVTSQRQPEAALSGFKPPSPVIWASVYPESQDDLAVLRQSLERLRLTDSSISYEEEKSGIMGRGFRCGFLGMLHLEIVTERLHREFNLEIILTLRIYRRPDYRRRWLEARKGRLGLALRGDCIADTHDTRLFDARHHISDLSVIECLDRYLGRAQYTHFGDSKRLVRCDELEFVAFSDRPAHHSCIDDDTPMVGVAEVEHKCTHTLSDCDRRRNAVDDCIQKICHTDAGFARAFEYLALVYTQKNSDFAFYVFDTRVRRIHLA